MKKLFLLLLSISAVLLGCERQETHEKPEGSISLYVDNQVILADGTYAANLTVTIMDKTGEEIDVTSDVEIFCEGLDEPLAAPAFATSEAGAYTFYAISGFEISNTVTVKAINGDLQLPEDPNPSASAFSHRMLLLQHTGTECPNCPRLMTQLRYLANDPEYSSLYHHVASHSYNSSDPAYTSDASSLSKNFDVSYYPWLTYNLTSTAEMDFDNIKASVDKLKQDSAAAGLSVSVDQDGKGVYANVSLKAGKSGKYRVAAWLLEDNIRAAQSGADASWQNIHENCLRKMYGSNKTECIYGKNIGTLEAGASKEFLVAFDLENDWKAQNCKVFVIAVDAASYELLNCTVCGVGESVAYQYIN